MIVSRPLTYRRARPGDWAVISDLADHAQRVHTHLDWQPVNEWLGRQPFLLAMDGEAVVGALACPPDPPHVGWIRLLAVADSLPVGDVLRALWPPARADLEHQGARASAALAIEAWVSAPLEAQGFRKVNEVIVLRRRRGPTPDVWGGPIAGRLRRARDRDLAAIEAVDRLAFEPLWQISAQALRAALTQAYYATVVERDDRILGYQISTAGRGAGHLARLAVAPAAQGEGLGSVLVRDALRFFERRGAAEVTVNTQQDNSASLAVYRRFGFSPTGESYAALQITLAGQR